MNKYNIKELAEKLERCRNVNLDDVNGKLVRISFLEKSNLTAEDCLTNVLKNLYR